MPGKRDYDDYDADQMCELLHDRDTEIKRLKQEVARLKRATDSNPTDARDQGAAPAAPVVGAWTAGGQPRSTMHADALKIQTMLLKPPPPF